MASMPFTPIASTPLLATSSLSALGWMGGGAQADMQTSLAFHFTPPTLPPSGLVIRGQQLYTSSTGQPGILHYIAARL